MPERPHILLISTDTQRWDTLRCMGSSFARSPHTDRLAEEGVLFEQGHTASPACAPARCSLIAGVHPQVHGVLENGIRPNFNLRNFPDLLAEAGYTGILSGKTHFGETPGGFHINYSTDSSKTTRGCDIWLEALQKAGFSEKPVDYPHSVPEDLYYDGFVTGNTIRGIEEALETRPSAPFFDFCSMVSPHYPLNPPGNWGDLYRAAEFPPLPEECGVGDEPEQTQQLLRLSERTLPPPEEIEKERRLYYGLAAYCDAQVGRLLQFLEERGLAEDTLVLFTSDHGTDLYDHGFDDKHVYYDSTWRVPFILRWPGAIPAGETRQFAHWNDIAPSLLAAAGLEFPHFQGFDLITPLREGRENPRSCAVATLHKSCALATKYWKFEYYFEDGSCRLFHRLKDPGEYNNLAEEEAFRDVRSSLLEALLRWYGDVLPTEYLSREARGGARVSREVTRMMGTLKGTDAEVRLNQAAEAIDRQFSG